MQSYQSNAGVAEKLVRRTVAASFSRLRIVDLSEPEKLPRNWQSLGDVTASLLGRLKVDKTTG